MSTAAGVTGVPSEQMPVSSPRPRRTRRARRTAVNGRTPATLTTWTGLAGAVTVAVLAFIGGWQRRWISDDGLIVLRTVRNLLAGNGPVFNAGERVEANTSTLWQYLIYLVALVSDARLEDIAMWLALLSTTVALGLAAWGTTRLYGRRSALLLIPVGALIYLALPPARDFATSGLEWGLSLLWLAGLWWFLTTWATSRDPEDRVLLGLAFWTGLSWLVRPELALYGGLAGLLILLAATGWRQRVVILALALPLPAGYQIFRMGYYGLLTPHTAVAKSASDSDWADGWNYLLDLVEPYGLWIALSLVVLLAAVTLLRFTRPEPGPGEGSEGPTGLARLRTRPAVIGLILLAGVIHLLYVLRVGGDFMHGRMLLLPLFALLLPVAVVPVADLRSLAPRAWRWDVPAVLATVAALWWSGATVLGGHPVDWETDYEELNIVDERDFWTFATFRDKGDPPRYSEDFLDTTIMNDYVTAVGNAKTHDDALVPSILIDWERNEHSWITTPRVPRENEATDPTGLSGQPPTVYHINLGMTSMNAPLEVRVLDTVGLTTPLAARQPRDEDGRVGHDKWLPWSWQAADTAVDLDHLPVWYGRGDVEVAREALQTPAIAELLATYREPMSVGRFLRNIRFALTESRSLEIPLDPAEALAELGPATPGMRIAWPIDVSPESPR